MITELCDPRGKAPSRGGACRRPAWGLTFKEGPEDKAASEHVRGGEAGVTRVSWDCHVREHKVDVWAVNATLDALIKIQVSSSTDCHLSCWLCLHLLKRL